LFRRILPVQREGFHEPAEFVKPRLVQPAFPLDDSDLVFCFQKLIEVVGTLT
jgi:hypothetical protein